MLIDVRTPDEFAQAHGQDAINLELSCIEAGELPDAPKSSKLYLYCRSGGRASVAQQLLEKAGYSVENLGGVEDLPKYGIPVVR